MTNLTTEMMNHHTAKEALDYVQALRKESQAVDELIAYIARYPSRINFIVKSIRAEIGHEKLLDSDNIPTPLTVWYGNMPESNGKQNWTAVLMRKGDDLFEGAHHTIARSEYPDRVRYEADKVRFIIGELPEEPFILDYDANLHSGFKDQLG